MASGNVPAVEYEEAKSEVNRLRGALENERIERDRNVQALDVYRVGEADWQRRELPMLPLQISDLREFVAVVQGRKRPDYTVEHDLAVQEALLRASGMWTARK